MIGSTHTIVPIEPKEKPGVYPGIKIDQGGSALTGLGSLGTVAFTLPKLLQLDDCLGNIGPVLSCLLGKLPGHRVIGTERLRIYDE
jgi:hypothetical protein